MGNEVFDVQADKPMTESDRIASIQRATDLIHEQRAEIERLRAENAQLREGLSIMNTQEQNIACDAQHFEREIEQLSAEVSRLRAENTDHANTVNDWRKKAGDAQRELDWLRRRVINPRPGTPT